MAIYRDVGVAAHRVVNRSNQADHVIDRAVGEHTIMGIATFGTGHVKVKLQSGEAFCPFCQSLTAIVIWRPRGISALSAEVIVRAVFGVFRLPPRSA